MEIKSKTTSGNQGISYLLLCSLAMFCHLTSGGLVEVTFDHRNKLCVLAEASVVKCIVTKAVNCLHVNATLQQHLHCVLTAILTTQNQRCPEGGQTETV